MVIRKMLTGAACAFAIMAAGCSPAAMTEPEWAVERRAEFVLFKGLITAESATGLSAELVEGDHLWVASPGGNRDAALTLAGVISDRQVSIEAAGQCSSACALYVILPARSASVMEGSTLLFHNTTAVWMTALERRPDLFTAAEADEIRSHHQALSDRLQTNGISPDVLSCIDAALQPDIGAARRSDTHPGVSPERGEGVVIPNAYDFVWLSPEVLKHFGAKVTFEWTLHPEARETFQQMSGGDIRWVDSVDQCHG